MVIRYEPDQPAHLRYTVDPGFLTPQVRTEVVTIGRLINAFSGWELNSCEALVKNGTVYPIDYANADIWITSLHYYFVSDQPVRPAELSGVLRSAGTVRDQGPASGAGWTGTRYGNRHRIRGPAGTGPPPGDDHGAGTGHDEGPRVRRLRRASPCHRASRHPGRVHQQSVPGILVLTVLEQTGASGSGRRVATRPFGIWPFDYPERTRGVCL
jgi:hypothetical protein